MDRQGARPLRRPGRTARRVDAAGERERHLPAGGGNRIEVDRNIDLGVRCREARCGAVARTADERAREDRHQEARRSLVREQPLLRRVGGELDRQLRDPIERRRVEGERRLARLVLVADDDPRGDRVPAPARCRVIAHEPDQAAARLGASELGVIEVRWSLPGDVPLLVDRVVLEILLPVDRGGVRLGSRRLAIEGRVDRGDKADGLDPRGDVTRARDRSRRDAARTHDDQRREDGEERREPACGHATIFASAARGCQWSGATLPLCRVMRPSAEGASVYERD